MWQTPGQGIQVPCLLRSTGPDPAARTALEGNKASLPNSSVSDILCDRLAKVDTMTS